MKISAVIVAAGTGSRMGAGYNKVYMPLLDKPVLRHTLCAFAKSDACDEVVIVTGKEDFERAKAAAEGVGIKYTLTEGGETRQQSVINGITAASGELVAVHDGARALISPELIKEVINAALECGAAALGVMAKDTIKVSDKDGFITATVERSSAYQIQTPQVFMKDELIKAHKKAAEDGFVATDDCAVMERVGAKIKIVNGSYENIKLTTAEDMFTAEGILKGREGK